MPKTTKSITNISIIGNTRQRGRTVLQTKKDVYPITIIETFRIIANIGFTIVAVAPAALPLTIIRGSPFRYYLNFVGAIGCLAETFREVRGVESEVVIDRISSFVFFVSQTRIQAQLPPVPSNLGCVGHFENLCIRDITFHTAIRYGQRVMAGLQSATPKLIIIICSDRVSENFTRLSQNPFVRGLRQEDAILTGALFDVQTDATVGTFVSGRHHVVRAHRSIETISIRCAQRYGLFKVLHLRLAIFVFEDSGTTGHLVRTGFQTDEGLRFTGLRGFGHVGILRTGGLRQRIVDLIHVVEGLRHHHGDFTVVLTLHVVPTK